ncbi:MAG: hypothetical protein VB120_02855 [Lachnospiraceae bacterium]|nr:hypothetical protein [Lachnospiraceae bacterium]
MNKLIKKRPTKRSTSRTRRKSEKNVQKTLINKRFISQAYVSMLLITIALLMSFFDTPKISSVSERLDSAIGTNSYAEILESVQSAGKSSIAVIKNKAESLTNSILGNTQKTNEAEESEKESETKSTEKGTTYIPESLTPEG